MFTVDRVRGDIRDIGENDFPMLEELDVSCCKAIIGGQHFSFERISDVPDFMNDVRSPPPQTLNDRCQWTLSEDQSPDWCEYDAEAVGEGSPGPGPPFDNELVLGQDHGWAGHGAFTNISVTVMIHLSTRARAKSTG
jgi:hypothetical protein